MRVKKNRILLIVLGSVATGFSTLPLWAAQQPPQQPAAAMATPVPAAAPATAESAAQPSEQAPDAAPAAEASEEKTETAEAVAVPADPYRDILSQHPSRWDTLIQRRRDELTKMRRSRSEGWSKARRYWRNPWSESRRDAMDVRREAMGARRDDHSDWQDERIDARRRAYTPRTQSRRDWAEQRRNMNQLRSLMAQERMYSPYGYGTKSVGPMGDYLGSGPWGPGAYGYPW